MAENKKTSKDLLKLAAGIGGTAYTAKAVPMRRVADYMHNYLDGYYGPGVTNWQKTQLMGREAAKASRRFAYNSLLDPVEVLAYDKTGIPPQLHRRYLGAEKEIARLTNMYTSGRISFDDAKFQIRNIEKQVHFKLTNDFSNAHMFRQTPQNALSDYASKYVKKSNPGDFYKSAGGNNIGRYALRQWNLPSSKNVLFLKYATPAWADVVRGAQFDPNFYRAMTTLKNHKGNVNMAVEKVNALSRRGYFNPMATIKDGKVVFQTSPRWKSNFDWGGYNSVGIWDPEKKDKIRIIATDKRDVIGGFKGGGRDAINYVDSKEISIKEATRKIKEASNDPSIKSERKKAYTPRRFDPLYREEKAKGLRVGGSRNKLKNEMATAMNKYNDAYFKWNKVLKNPLSKSSKSALARVAPYVLRRAGLAGLVGYGGYKAYNWLKNRS